ncbi:MAG TPA: efflux RND transporter periplasmic adaptor subunit [Polyangiaceae bacterium]|nr:efflux RND transporter periplasmic adaptor subunit [Polyangiaceae bacterium]
MTRVAQWVVVGGLLLAGCHGESGAGLPPASGSGAPPPPVVPKLSEVASAAPATSAEPAAAWTGTLYARHEAALGPKASGVISQITVDEGDKVKKGQLMFRLDGAQAVIGVSQAKAAVATAKVGLDSAKLDLARATELSMKGSLAPAVYDQAKTTYDHAATALEQARVAQQLAERVASETAVFSPIDGVVTSKQKSVGETVTMVPPTTVLVVQDVAHLELRANLPENALAKLSPGSELRMNARSVGVERTVQVKRINPTLDPRTRTVQVVADVDNADGKLKVGMFVEVALAAPTSSAPPSDTAKVASDVGGSKAP